MSEAAKEGLPEMMARLMEAGAFPGETEISRRRGAASVGLAWLAGLNSERQAALLRFDWCPGGREVVVARYPEGDKEEAKGREVPILPSLKRVVERYLSERGALEENAPLIAGPRGEVVSRYVIGVRFKRVLGRSMAEATRIFGARLEECGGDPGLVAYLVGVGRASTDIAWSFSRPPPERDTRKLLLRAFAPYAKEWRHLWAKR